MLKWVAGVGATYYDLIFLRGRRRVLDLWIVRPRAVVGPGELPPGSYSWFVYPGFGKRSTHSYGALIAKGSVVIRGGG